MNKFKVGDQIINVGVYWKKSSFYMQLFTIVHEPRPPGTLWTVDWVNDPAPPYPLRDGVLYISSEEMMEATPLAIALFVKS